MKTVTKIIVTTRKIELDIDEFFKRWNKQHDKKYPMSKDLNLFDKKRSKLFKEL